METRVWIVNNEQLVVADTLEDAASLYKQKYEHNEIYTVKSVYTGSLLRRYDALIDTKLIK